MIPAIMIAAACLATEVIDCDVNDKRDITASGSPPEGYPRRNELVQQSANEQPLLVAEKESVKKTLGQRIKEKIKTMIKIRRGFTVDSGAADHVMPLGWLAWILVTASLGSISGVNFISANGAKNPKQG